MTAAIFVFGTGDYKRGVDERGGVIRLAPSNVANVYFESGECIHPMRNLNW